MKVYISASWKLKDDVHRLADGLRDLGYEVFDFTDQTRRDASILPPGTDDERHSKKWVSGHESYGEFLGKKDYSPTVYENLSHIKDCDVVVLLLPAGCDAHADYGAAIGMGKAAVVVGEPPDGDASPTHCWAKKFYPNIAVLLRDFGLRKQDDGVDWLR